ncbi:MAG: polymerase subunit sigma-24, partial [Alphaproteobacteria bacterium]|nr:polymerase subunit sigma-24 [Alphaproteobacteria bacterium]
MADNLLLDRRRYDGRRIVREAAGVADQRHGSGERSDAPSAVQQLIDRERLAAVSSALAELPERTLSIFRRFRVEGIPQKQIAEELEISVSAVEKHLQRAYHVVTEARARLDADIAGSRRPLGREE